jgi:hypothetical protein
MTSFARSVAAAAILVLATASHASADPVTITAGSLFVPGVVELGSISLTGTRGFSLNGNVTPNEGVVEPFFCLPCEPGSAIGVGAFLAGPAFVATGTIDGSGFALEGTINDPTSLVLQFLGSAIAAPSVVEGPAVVTAPFTATGSLQRLADPSVSLRGSGTVSIFFSPIFVAPDAPAIWEVDQVRYDFAQAAPVPEPGTLTLLTIGFAAAAVRARTAGRRKA